MSSFPVLSALPPAPATLPSLFFLEYARYPLRWVLLHLRLFLEYSSVGHSHVQCLMCFKSLFKRLFQCSYSKFTVSFCFVPWLPSCFIFLHSTSTIKIIICFTYFSRLFCLFHLNVVCKVRDYFMTSLLLLCSIWHLIGTTK